MQLVIDGVRRGRGSLGSARRPGPPASLDRARVPRGWFLLGLLVLLTGCTTPKATYREGLDYGFRTPEQAFRSWRTAIQGDQLAEEYKSLSKAWRARNDGVSLFGYAEARERLLERYPQLRWALSRTAEPELVAKGDDVRIYKARIELPFWALFAQDRWLVVRVVRQRFWEVWIDDYPYEPEFGAVLGYDAPAYPAIQKTEAGGEVYLYGVARGTDPAFKALETREIHLIRAGSEWKIDDFQVFEEVPESLELLQRHGLQP